MQYCKSVLDFRPLAMSSLQSCILAYSQLQRFSYAVDPGHALKSEGVFLRFCSTYIGHTLLQTLFEDVRLRKLYEGWMGSLWGLDAILNLMRVLGTHFAAEVPQTTRVSRSERVLRRLGGYCEICEAIGKLSRFTAMR